MKPVNSTESTGVNLGGDEDEDLLLQEARQQHAKVRLNSLARTQKNPTQTPIKEEDIEDDDFCESNKHITEAQNNYESSYD